VGGAAAGTHRSESDSRIENIHNDICVRLVLRELSLSMVYLLHKEVHIPRLRCHLTSDDINKIEAIHHYPSEPVAEQFVSLDIGDMTLFLSVAQAKAIRRSLAPSNMELSD
tara:strand:+ start:4259 stop:4591 length:333 start_codon:yes stop_codon:yes gene_type:complete